MPPQRPSHILRTVCFVALEHRPRRYPILCLALSNAIGGRGSVSPHTKYGSIIFEMRRQAWSNLAIPRATKACRYAECATAVPGGPTAPGSCATPAHRRNEIRPPCPPYWALFPETRHRMQGVTPHWKGGITPTPGRRRTQTVVTMWPHGHFTCRRMRSSHGRAPLG